MKKIMGIMIAMLLCMTMLLGCGNKETTQDQTEEQVTGGWTDEETEDIPEDAQAAFDKAMEGYTGMQLVPVKYLGSQVVAGTNYKFLCQGTTVTEEPESGMYEVVVYQDLDGNAEITDVTEAQ